MIVVIGGGVVGLHVGIALAQLPNRPPIFVFEREGEFAAHSSGRNSEVVHAGFAYPSGTLKELTCVEGNRLSYEWLERLSVPHLRCGKWIVALERAHTAGLEALLAVGRAAGVMELRWASAAEVAEGEPDCVRFPAALYSGTSGVMDGAAYVRALHDYFVAQPECHFLKRCEVTAIGDDQRSVETSRGPIECDAIVNAAGLWADAVYRMAGGQQPYRIKAFKGEYYVWRKGPIRGLVYPVPPRFLARESDGQHTSNMGIHAHRSAGGEVLVGPTRVDDWGTIADYSITTEKQTFVDAARLYAPLRSEDDLQPAYAGNRSKIYLGDKVQSDFQIMREGRVVHLLGIESPGLTAAPALAKRVAALIGEL